MVAFALSCFGLLLFVWLSFGGAVPLKPHGYRVNVVFAEATQLGLEADVRTAGVRIGKVRKKDLDPRGNGTVATLELDRRFAPLRQDAKAILRQKTLLGETYIEITPGSESSPPVKENGYLGRGQVRRAVELDEILQALDPTTREAFRRWQQDMGAAARGRGRDLNDAIGNLPAFAADGADLLEVLDSHSRAVRGLVRNTGVVFGALAENEDQLRQLIVSSGDVFDATASQREALAETFRVFPTFLDESKRTMARLETFSDETDPLITELRPAARDLAPTLADARRLAPDLERFFRNLDPLITVSRRGLPALREVLQGTRPLLSELGPFLEQLNPILRWLEYYQHQTADFITNGAGALADTVATIRPEEIGHYLRQLGPTGTETVAMWPQRLRTNRGNAYPGPLYHQTQKSHDFLIFPNFDCRNAGGEFVSPGKGTGDNPNDPRGPGCLEQAPSGGFPGRRGRYAHIDRADYSR
jgi:phospholipid/cholesterol/gamma-HCH transport system substrate-binding protein